MFQPLQAALDLLYPPRCPACRVRTEVVAFCGSCRHQITAPVAPMCTVCGLPFAGAGRDHPCHDCRLHPPKYRRARARAAYGRDGHNPLIGVLARLKYGRDVTMAPVLAAFLVERLPIEADHDLIIPVPLHRDRLRWRGFNQAVPLARAVGRACDRPIDPFALARRWPTLPQVGLDAGDRRRNVRDAFVVRRPQQVHGRRILLVDDVMTTGATAHECAHALRAAGARHVDALVLARALDPA